MNPVMTEKKGTDLRDRTKSFAVRIVRLYGALPKSTTSQVIGKQLLRSGTSVGAHYREGYRARAPAEFVVKIKLHCKNSTKRITGSNYLSTVKSSSASC